MLKKVILKNREKTERHHANIQSQILSFESKIESVIKKHDEIESKIELANKKKQDEINFK